MNLSFLNIQVYSLLHSMSYSNKKKKKKKNNNIAISNVNTTETIIILDLRLTYKKNRESKQMVSIRLYVLTYISLK